MCAQVKKSGSGAKARGSEPLLAPPETPLSARSGGDPSSLPSPKPSISSSPPGAGADPGEDAEVMEVEEVEGFYSPTRAKENAALAEAAEAKALSAAVIHLSNDS